MTNDITAGRIADALVAAAERRALTAEARLASYGYTEAQLDAAYSALRDGTHQYYPAAGHWLAEIEAAWANYSRQLLARGRVRRDARTGQLALEFAA